MVKFRGKSKNLAVLILSAMMLLGTGTTAFAYVDPSADTAVEAPAETESTTETETQAETEPVVQENTVNTEDAFSVPGNAQLQDDIKNGSSKEFLTVTTKNNNTFYVIIDRSAATENVYMLSQIDEQDLKDFLDEDETATVAEAKPSVVIEEKPQEETAQETEPQKEEKKSSNTAAMLGILVLAVAGVGGYAYFKFLKPKKEEEETKSEGLEVDDGYDEESDDFDE